MEISDKIVISNRIRWQNMRSTGKSQLTSKKSVHLLEQNLNFKDFIYTWMILQALSVYAGQ